MLTSATGEETLTPNPNECNSTLTSGTRGIYPHCYILMLMSGVTGYEFATRHDDSPFRRLTISTTHHFDDLPSRRLTITTTSHFDDLPSRRLTITTTYHHDESPFRRLTITTNHHFRRPSITKERLCQCLDMKERQSRLSITTTSHYEGDLPFGWPSISMTFHYDETFLTRSPRHNSPTSLACNFVFVGPNNFKFLTKACCMVL